MAAVLFGFVSILATYTGIETGGAIVNTRVIGVLSAGLLGGPVIGIGAALIGGIHRYFYEAGQLTAAACAVSTMAEGMIGVVCSKYFHRGKWDNGMLFLLTAITEVRRPRSGEGNCAANDYIKFLRHGGVHRHLPSAVHGKG